MKDLYPSRVNDDAQLTQRLDPVIYGEHADGPLSQEQLDAYESNGFLCIEGLLPADEVRGLQQELERVRDCSSRQNRPDVIREPGGTSVRSVFDVHRTNDVFQALVRDRRLLGIAQQLLGRGVYVHQSRVNYKPGFEGKDFYWHSDFETWHVEDGMPRMRAVSCAVSLSENNEFNGPLMVIPGSHRHYVVCVGKTPENHYQESLKKQVYGVPDPDSLATLVEQGGIQAAKGPAGSSVFFDCNTMHGSNSNITPWSRSNVFFVYNSVENSLVAPFCGLEPRPDYIASRKFEPIDPL